jgi:phosphoglycolate phosphatase
MPQLLGLIFDLDGTLIDSAVDLRLSVNELLRSYKKRDLTLDEVKSSTGDGMLPLLCRSFEIAGDPISSEKVQELFAEFMRIHEQRTTSSEQLYPHVLDIISGFRHSGVKIGLCTNKLHKLTLKLLSDVGINELFDIVVGGDTFEVRKPDPKTLLGTADLMKVSPQSCIMIGDSANDIVAAQAAQMTNIVITHGYGKDVYNLGADAILSSFKELPAAIQKLNFSYK